MTMTINTPVSGATRHAADRRTVSRRALLLLLFCVNNTVDVRILLLVRPVAENCNVVLSTRERVAKPYTLDRVVCAADRVRPDVGFTNNNMVSRRTSPSCRPPPVSGPTRP